VGTCNSENSEVREADQMMLVMGARHEHTTASDVKKQWKKTRSGRKRCEEAVEGRSGSKRVWQSK
jgi:hypothetical protein